mgnify:CR=1 FL=1
MNKHDVQNVKPVTNADAQSLIAECLNRYCSLMLKSWEISVSKYKVALKQDLLDFPTTYYCGSQQIF